ncbi:MAG: S-methyl-5'-thioadenosine phosphorylase [Candidatus Omnitrophica bacterium]|nr:S-methyl-5'-thioadenosine phosphorylase [Candidatus Omnitrophota bacterium]
MERIGIIGGSGLYQLEGLKNKKEIVLNTPFGKPSDKFVLAKIEDREIVFLPRHGRFHTLSPTQINYRANIYGFKKLNVGWLISVTACGSLKEEIRPLDFVIPTQFVDRTNQARCQTFFDEGIVVHVGFSKPICENLANILDMAVKEIGLISHYGKTYINMEGPQFSTLAESNLYRSWDMDIIGMTNMTEARLAKEASICYATLAAVTDYDCWHPQHDHVSVDMILENLSKNVNNAKKILKRVILKIPKERNCSCKEALKYSIVTDKKYIPSKIKKRLKIIIGEYLK